MSTSEQTQTYLVEVTHDGYPMGILYVDATSEDEAAAHAAAKIGEEDEVASAAPLQPILDGWRDKIAQGTRVSIMHKDEDEGGVGPVWIVDLDEQENDPVLESSANGAAVIGRPYGYRPGYETRLPWMTPSAARRVAQYLGLELACW